MSDSEGSEHSGPLAQRLGSVTAAHASQADAIARIKGNFEAEVRRLSSIVYAQQQLASTAKLLRSRCLEQAAVISRLHERAVAFGLVVFFRLSSRTLLNIASFLTPADQAAWASISVAHRNRLLSLLQPTRSRAPEGAGSAPSPSARSTASRASDARSEGWQSTPKSVTRTSAFRAASPRTQGAMAAAEAWQARGSGSEGEEARRGAPAQRAAPARSSSMRFNFFQRRMVEVSATPAGVVKSNPKGVTFEQAGRLLSSVKALDAKCAALASQVSDLQQKLTTAEQVKDFLAGQVAQKEQVNKELQGKVDAATHQALTDKQVIVFLDEANSALTAERDAAVGQLALLQADGSTDKPSIPPALVQAATQPLCVAAAVQTEGAAGPAETGEGSAAWKKQRKLLVAEVKRLRAALSAAGLPLPSPAK
ncbi:unnamed protein product [Symbiodinium sp. KB8]|nr:unnamed protein product [Symbiodinium sp. KB8]